MTAKSYDLTVRRVISETQDASSIELDVPSALSETFSYMPGQFLSFEIDIDGEIVRRCYSLSSTPGIDPHNTVTVKRVAGGRVSNWLNDRVKPGDRLTVAPPAGRFILGATETPLCLYAGGSGITPIISILKFALRHWKTPIYLFYANRDAGSVIFKAALDWLATDHSDRLHIKHHLDVRDGLTSEAEITAFTAGARDARHYICGPAPFMELVEAALVKNGVPGHDIHVERFTVSDATLPTETTDTAVSEASLTITLDGRSHSIRTLPGETILEAGRRLGLQPPSSCESGICASCLARVKKGRAIMRHNEVLNADEIAEGLVLTCQAVASSSELHVEY